MQKVKTVLFLALKPKSSMYEAKRVQDEACMPAPVGICRIKCHPFSC